MNPDNMTFFLKGGHIIANEVATLRFLICVFSEVEYEKGQN